MMHRQETENNMLASDVLTPHCTDEQTEAQRGQLTCSWCSLKRELIIIVPARGSGRGAEGSVCSVCLAVQERAPFSSLRN